MSKATLLLAALLLFPLHSLALERISPEGAPITVYQTDEEFAFVKEMLEMAIIGQGLVITSTLQISDLYQRAAADLGHPESYYERAEAFEFCSIRVSFLMSAADLGNLAVCPLTIAFYQPSGESHVHISYRKQALLGDAAEAEAALHQLLDGIVREALE